MTILITGADGYVGWPTALRTADRTDDRVLLVDNFARREWVDEVGSVSATPVRSIETRLDAAEETHGLTNLSFVEGDLTNKEFVDEILAVHEPDTIVHTAAQPSAPYSQINGERANYTQHNNLQATRNLLWGLEEHDLTDTHFVETTTTGVYGAPEFPIPEGGATMENQGDRDEVPFPAMAGSWYHLCYDEDTEILTNEGWKEFPELTESDKVMAMDAESGETKWTVPTEIQSYDYTGEMVTVSNRRIDLKVTPNHRMLIGTSWAQGGEKTFEDRRKVVQADELGDEYQYPCFFASFPDWDGQKRETFTLPACDQKPTHPGNQIIKLAEKEIELDSWIRFFGWWITEGSIGIEGQTNNVRIYQTGAEELVKLFTKIGFNREKIRHHVDTKQEYIEISDLQLATYLRQFKDQKHIPQWMLNLSREKLDILLTTLIDGDGTQNGRGWKFYTSSPQLADDVQEIALKLGYSAVIGSQDRSEGDNYQTKPEYIVNISPSWCIQANQEGSAFDREQYDGKVYCCTVDGGIVLVRRNGKPVWCGNSKSHDAANMRLAHQQFDIPISDVRTAIVYGTQTEETRADDRLNTRFDFDYYFGTVAHRFAAQAVAGYPVTVYGKGEQRKPFIGLEDAVEGLAQLALIDPDDRPDDHVVYNQTTRAISIVEIANTIADVGTEHGLDVDVEHFENPRDEDETHKMEIEHDRYDDLIGEQAQDFEAGIQDVFATLTDHTDVIEAHEDRFLPGVLEDRLEE
nr:NAD-dependent epimerase/dehydratase family protein [Halorubrum sp. GN12_10-3_MGM]